MTNIENPIAQNRTEELGYDLWDDFVIPPYYDKLDLLDAKKPRVIVGGRGCGKTMLLRYLCHQSQFSQKREFKTADEIRHVGLYWKIDTQFAKLLTKRGLEDEEWQSAFQHMAVLTICKEVLKSIESIAQSKYPAFKNEDIIRLDLSILNSFSSDVPDSFQLLKEHLRKQYNRFQTWASNIKRNPVPTFLPKSFAIELINELKEQVSILKNTTFFIYIDEYENLLVEQQQLLNTWLKHSEMPLIFNVAMKRESFTNKTTVGNEQLVSIHDYKEYDLESFHEKDSDFNLFAAEILFLRLAKHGIKNLPIKLDVLRNPMYEAIISRKSKIYKSEVITYAKKYLPSPSQEEMAKEILLDSKLKNRLIKLITNALEERNSKFQPHHFISEKYPEASVIIPALLSRRLKETDILSELKKLEEGKENRYTGKTDWIHNNFIGCLLLLYEPLPRPCKVYSGFEAFCKMSHSNIRHFLELCNKSISVEKLGDNFINFEPIDPEKQAEAAKQTSTSLLKEIKSFGTNGAALYTFVLRLGLYFAVLHKKPSQSEPEQNHFALKESFYNQKLASFLSECIKWSVLYESEITKQKGGTASIEVESVEYVLNPVYAPYFHISYRKSRKVLFTEKELATIMFGEVPAFRRMLSKHTKDLENILMESQLPLFQAFKIFNNED